MRLALLGLVALAVAAAGPSEDVLRVQLEASAAGKGAEGRAAAIAKAKEDAVFGVIQSMTGAEDPLLFRPLLDNASKYIQSCQVLEQKENADRTEVKVDAYVMEQRLKKDLASVVLPLFPKPPRVVIVVAEGEGVLPHPTIERKLAETLEVAGLEVVDPVTACARLEPGEVEARVKGDAGMAARFAWENLADVAVVGEATVATGQAPAGSNLRPNRANLVLRIIRGDDGRTFDVRTAEAVVKSVDPVEGGALALMDACDKIKGDVLVSTVLAAAGSKGTPYVVVTVENLAGPEQWRQLCERARECAGVEEAEELYFGGDHGRLRLKYSGAMGPLVDSLTEEPYSGFRVAPRQVVERDITLSVVR